MKILTNVSELRAAIREASAVNGGLLGLVPTMGALHAGHISLVKLARKQCGTVVVSDFVNPTQFNDKTDLVNYPRTLSADARLLEAEGVDLLFAPTVEEIYPVPDTRTFDFGAIERVMEGAARPGHFNGVGQVVSRLFAIVEPDKAYFGQKDFQQIAVIRELVGQLELKVEIVECPICRDSDGLALSSRNTLLDSAHRAAAPHIYATLSAAAAKVGSLTPAQLTEWVTAQIDLNPLLRTLYFCPVDALTMQTVESWDDAERVQGCVAVQCGSIRLIDNIRLK